MGGPEGPEPGEARRAAEPRPVTERPATPLAELGVIEPEAALPAVDQPLDRLFAEA